MTTETLKPCPFCEKGMEMTKESSYGPLRANTYHFKCSGCGWFIAGFYKEDIIRWISLPQ